MINGCALCDAEFDKPYLPSYMRRDNPNFTLVCVHRQVKQESPFRPQDMSYVLRSYGDGGLLVKMRDGSTRYVETQDMGTSLFHMLTGR